MGPSCGGQGDWPRKEANSQKLRLRKRTLKERWKGSCCREMENFCPVKKSFHSQYRSGRKTLQEVSGTFPNRDENISRKSGDSSNMTLRKSESRCTLAESNK